MDGENNDDVHANVLHLIQTIFVLVVNLFDNI
jgi:hypothetical protein